MLHLLHIEWLKVRNYRTFWLLLLITVISIPAFNYVIYDFMDNSFPKVKGKSILGRPFDFPDVWQTVSFNSSLLLLIPAVMIITLTTNEFSFKTHRQNVIDGWSRSQFINVKLLEILFLSIATTAVVFITSLCFGLLGSASHQSSGLFSGSRFAVFFFIQMLSYSLIAFLIGMFIKRAGLAMGVFFIYMIVEQLLVAILKKRYGLKGADYFPQEVTDLLIPQPFTQKFFDGPEKIRIWEANLATYLFVAVTYILIYCLVSNWKFRKADI